MKMLQVLLLTTLFGWSVNAQNVVDSLEWAKQFTDLGLGNLIVETDTFDNIFVAGTYLGCDECLISYESETLVTQGNGSRDIFLAKLNSDGDLISSHLFGGEGEDGFAGFKIDGDNNLYLYLKADAPFTIGNVLLEKGYNIVKLDNEFNLLWSVALKGNWSNIHADQFSSLREQFAITPNNEVIVGGSIPIQYNFDVILDTLIFGGDTTYIYPAFFAPLEIDDNSFFVDTNNIFVAKIGSEGDLNWARTFEHTGWINLSNIVVSNNGDINLLGDYNRNDWLVAGDTLEASSGNLGNAPNTFILKLNKNGVFQWVNKYLDGLTPLSITTDREDNLIALGYFDEAIYSDMDTIYGIGNGGTDFALFKVDAIGNYIWGRVAGDESPNNQGQIIANNANEIFISGLLSSLQGEIMNKFSASGELLWELNPIGSSNRTGQDLVFDYSGNLIQTATYGITFKIGNYTFTPQAGGGGWQNVIMKYKNQNPTIPNITNSSTPNRKKEIKLDLFPNPAYGGVEVSYYLPHPEDVKIKLININGETIMAKKLNSAEEGITSFNLESLSPGYYFIEIIGKSVAAIKPLVVMQ